MQFTDEILNNAKFKILLLDANIIIPFLDRDYAKKDVRAEIVPELARLVSLGIDLIYPQPCYLEILNYFRGKWIFKACDRIVRYQSNPPYKLKGILMAAETRRRSEDPERYLYDSEIKKIRTLLYSRPKLWTDIAQIVSGQIKKLEAELTNSKIHYAKFDSNYYPFEDKINWPKWDGMHSLIENHLLASSDAAILNMAKYSKIDGFVSNDSDLIIAVTNGAYEKTKFFQV